MDEWTAQEQMIAEREGTDEARLRFNVSRSTIFVHAGFNKDKGYLGDVLDWLDQDLHNAEEAGLEEVAKAIRDEIEAMGI